MGPRSLGLAAAGLVLASLVAGDASARELTGAERSRLARAVTSFDTAMRRRNVPVIIGVVPPRVLAHIAASNGVPLAKLRQTMIGQTREVMTSSVLQDFRMDLAAARHASLPDGTPYALVPTQTTIRLGEQASQISSDTLAMMDGGKWYLLDLGTPSRVAIFTQVYPEFAGVAFGGKTTKAVP